MTLQSNPDQFFTLRKELHKAWRLSLETGNFRAKSWYVCQVRREIEECMQPSADNENIQKYANDAEPYDGGGSQKRWLELSQTFECLQRQVHSLDIFDHMCAC